MKIAVTGASGHVGANLIRRLYAEGHEVRVLSHKDQRALKNIDLTIIKGSLEDINALKELVSGADYVYHLAALISISGKTDREVYQTNVEGTRNISAVALEYNVKRLFHFSSIHAFEQHPLDEVLDENRQLAGTRNPLYDQSKAEGERIILNIVDKGLDAVILSPTSILGPFDFKPSLMGQVLIKIHDGKLPALVPGGYDWVDVRDIVDVAIAAIEKAVKGQKYLMSGKWLSIKELSVMIGQITGRKTPSWVCPIWLARASLPFLNIYDKARGNDILYTNQSLDILVSGNRKISNSRACRELGFKVRPLQETISDSYEWFSANNYLTKQYNNQKPDNS